MWSRELAGILAQQGCVACCGDGMVSGEPCRCARREAYRSCLYKYRYFASLVDAGLTRPTMRRGRFERGLECFLADFELSGRRLLSADLQVLFAYQLLNVHWMWAAMRLKVSAGAYWNLLTKLEQAMGDAVVARGLCPVNTYLWSPVEMPGEPEPVTVRERRRRAWEKRWGKLVPPLRQQARAA